MRVLYGVLIQCYGVLMNANTLYTKPYSTHKHCITVAIVDIVWGAALPVYCPCRHHGCKHFDCLVLLWLGSGFRFVTPQIETCRGGKAVGGEANA